MTGIDRARRSPDHRAGTEGKDLADPDRDRSINRMSWIAFILAAIAGLVSIIYVRPAPAQVIATPEIIRSK